MTRSSPNPQKSSRAAGKPIEGQFDPRLPPSEKGKKQERLMEVMLERFSINEIAESICSAGFLPLDPFIGYREGASVYVLEGNRRVATLQLLLNPKKLAPPRFANTWEGFRARLDEKALAKIRSIPVQVYPDRRDARILAYIGYRHVNGVLPWDAQEKAAYIAHLVEDARIQWSYKEI